MNANTKALTLLPAWTSLAKHSTEIKKIHLRHLFAKDATRGERFTGEAAGLFLDYSKNRVTETSLKLLLQLAEECDLRGRIEAMFRGERINITENRAVLHVALRAPKNATSTLDGKNVVPEVHAVLDKMTAFSNRVRSGEWLGHTGEHISLHLERRWHRFRGSYPRPRSGRNTIHCLFQDFHHSGDNDQRGNRA
jgi:glucose-6-phosphate isomerase